MRSSCFAAAALAAIALIHVHAQQPACTAAAAAAQPVDPKAEARLGALKTEGAAGVDDLQDFTQKMVDSVFSFGELGFQEIETSKYLTNILRQQGFTIEQGSRAFRRRGWRHGDRANRHRARVRHRRHPDRIAEARRRLSRSVYRRRARHGEGHNSGMPLNITAAIVLKKIMQREKIPGTIKLWPGVAEELLGTKAYYVREGYFKDVDVVFFTHIGSNWGVNWGDGTSNGLVSVEYTFKGESAHSAGAPWRGRSALDAAMLMDIGWNYRREHLRIQQRSHSVITYGGNQPNVVPPSRRSGITSARPTIRTSNACGRSATTWRRPPR